MLICLKQKHWSKRCVPVTSNRCPDHLSRQFLTTASTFPYSSKNSSVEHINAFYTYPCMRECECASMSVWVCKCVWFCIWVRVCVCLCEWVCLWWWAMLIKHFYTYPCVRECQCVCVCVFLCVYVCVCLWLSVCVCVCVCVCLSMWVSLFVMVSHVDKARICSAEEFLELYGKVEAVVRNCVLRWLGHLFEVTGTHLFDQSFCFKHISLLYVPIWAFFLWY